MQAPAETHPSLPRRTIVFVALAVLLVGGLSVLSRVTHTATIPNVGLPPSNSRDLPGVSAYEPQVNVTRDYLAALTRLDYAAAYLQLAPSVRANVTLAAFESQRRQEGVLGQPTVWADDGSSTRAEYVLGVPGGGKVSRHRFTLLNEQGRWWIERETPLDTNLRAAPSLATAMTQYVQQQAGTIWTKSAELLRQEGFEDGQLLLFSYIEPDPAGLLTAQRQAVLTYFTHTTNGWEMAGGGTTGVPAAMTVADVSMGVTTFGPDQRYLAYFGVVENANAVNLNFQEPSGAGHSQSLRGVHTLLFINERNPFDPLPFARPFKALSAKDTYGNSMRVSPSVSPS